ncbi:uncharacterized protein LOC115955672 [Quercus lobata]|uniref:uncharacterized protein LOC115955672 n=1 Tax=Quercus lobata TaxID=97700 RepID=UPI00124503E9|nr:uncharacterized protein LOC115955672 [Quercus lobata]
MGFMSMKLDMSKAYDRVEWTYLEKIMEKMGFNRKWINLIAMCIRSVTYSIMLNGQPHGLITPTRGLRQGDPLSPYLFLLVTEGLHALFEEAKDSGEIRGVSLCPMGPRISHLLFADDSLVFCRATVAESVKIQSILYRYEHASGQCINRGKTNLFFSSNTHPEVQAAIKAFLGLPVTSRFEQYLGLPSLVGRSKKKSFSLIKERIWKKLKGWKERLLSQAGREILVKAVIQAIPIFTMSCFRLPKGLISEIETLIRKFWWGYRGDQKKIHWISWEKLCQPKKEGGMGFKELIKFNDSMLAKQIWRLENNEGCLFHGVFKAKFFPNGSVFDCEVSTKGSYASKSIVQARHVMDLGSVWRIGDGKSVKIRGDRWLPQNTAPKIVSPISVLPPGSMVCDLINQDEHQWKSDLIAREFLPHEANIIKGIPLSDRNIPDKQVWHASTHGVYTTRSAYKLLALADRNNIPTCSTNRRSSKFWQGIWSLQVPYKVRHFIWRAANESLPTLYNLQRRRVVQTAYCQNCKAACEDTVHALWGCHRLVVVWEKDAELMKCSRFKCSVFADLLELFFSLRDRNTLFQKDRVYERTGDRFDPYPGLLINTETEDPVICDPLWLSEMLEAGFIRKLTITSANQISDTYLSLDDPGALAQEWSNFMSNKIYEEQKELDRCFHLYGYTDRIVVYGPRPSAGRLIGKRRIVKDPRLMTAKDHVPVFVPISYCALCNDYGVLHEHEQYEDNTDPLDYDNYADTD